MRQQFTHQPLRSPVRGIREGASVALDAARRADAAWRASRNRRWQRRLDRVEEILRQAERSVKSFGELATYGVLATLITTLWVRYMDGAWFTPWLRPTFFAFLLLGFPLFIWAVVRGIARSLRWGMRVWTRSQCVEVTDIAADVDPPSFSPPQS